MKTLIKLLKQSNASVVISSVFEELKFERLLKENTAQGLLDEMISHKKFDDEHDWGNERYTLIVKIENEEVYRYPRYYGCTSEELVKELEEAIKEQKNN